MSCQLLYGSPIVLTSLQELSRIAAKSSTKKDGSPPSKKPDSISKKQQLGVTAPGHRRTTSEAGTACPFVRKRAVCLGPKDQLNIGVREEVHLHVPCSHMR